MIELGANDVDPVPPYRTPIDVVALTTPLFACSGPLREPPSVRVPTKSLVDDEFTNDE
jgi:hypothetical protein